MQSFVFGIFRSRWNDMIVRRELTDLPGQVVDNGKALIDAAKRAGQLSSTIQIAYQYQNVARIEDFGSMADMKDQSPAGVSRTRSTSRRPTLGCKPRTDPDACR